MSGPETSEGYLPCLLHVIVVFNQPCTLALFCTRVWFWGVTWDIRSSVNFACISVVPLEIESSLKSLSYDTKSDHSGAILRNSGFGVLSLCTRNSSLHSHRIIPISTWSEKQFSFLFERYKVHRVLCYFRWSPFVHHTCPHHFEIGVACHPLSVVYHHGLWEADLRGPRMSCCTYACWLFSQEGCRLCGYQPPSGRICHFPMAHNWECY